MLAFILSTISSKFFRLPFDKYVFNYFRHQDHIAILVLFLARLLAENREIY